MKHYMGDRTIDGVKVTVDGAPLDPCVNVMEFTKNGFEWSYEGLSRASSRWRCWWTISATRIKRRPRSSLSCKRLWQTSGMSGR